MFDPEGPVHPLNADESNRLYRSLNNRVTIGLLLASLLLGIVFSITTFQSKSEHARQQLSLKVQLVATALEAAIDGYRNQAVQVTSRSRIRQELESYQWGEVSRDRLVTFSSEKLGDALRSSANMIGMIRFGIFDDPLIEIGQAIPVHYWPRDFNQGKVQFGALQRTEGRLLLTISAPILDRNSEKVGTDIIMFDASELDQLMATLLKEHNNVGRVSLASIVDGSMQNHIGSGSLDIDKTLAQLEQKISDLLASESIDNIALDLDHHHVVSRISDTDIVLIYSLAHAHLNGRAMQDSVFIGAIALILALIGSLLTYIVIKPLAGRISIETETLHGLVGELADSKERFELAMKASNDGLWDWDIATDAVFYSPRWKSMLGYEQDELEDNLYTWDELTHPDDKERTMQLVQACIDGSAESFRAEIRMRHKQGHWVHILTQGMLERDQQGTPLRFVGTHSDISELHEQQILLKGDKEELQQLISERTDQLEDITRYNRTLFETSPIGLVLCRQDGSLVDVNPAYLDIIGYTQHEAHSLSYWDITPREYEQQEQEQLRSMAETGRYGPYDKEYVHKDGRRIPVRLNGLLIETRGETFIWSSVEDITTMKKAEIATNEVLQQAQRLAQAHSEFLANMSHEIRTPLNAMLGLAKIGHRGVSEQRGNELFGLISDSSEHLCRIVNDILDFSKIEAGKLQIENKTFSIRKSVHDVTRLIENQAKEKNLRLVVEISDNIASWHDGDAMRIEQILLNLLSNAIKFTEQGKIGLQVYTVGKSVVFKVEDTGIGIFESKLNSLFNPFEQEDTSTTRKYGGTGLGLSICKNLSSLMGGSLQASSTPGSGSIFTLSLPLNATNEMEIPLQQRSSGERRRLSDIHILAAEDIEVNRMVLFDLLESEGANVVFATDGAQAVDSFKAQHMPFDIVLMDIQMPEMDGYEATRKILEIDKRMPVIGLTAHAMSDERQRCLDIGMVDHIAKPVDSEVLVSAILQHLPDKQTNSESQSDKDTVIDEAALQKRYAGKSTLIYKLSSTFLRTHGDTADKIREAIEQQDYDSLRHMAHSIKGLSGYLEANELRRVSEHAQLMTESNDIKALDACADLANALDRVVEALSQRV